MQRRTFLAGASGASVGLLAGCGTLGEPTELTDTETVTEDDEMEHHVTFYRDDTEQATLSVMQRTAPETYADRFSLRLHLWHREGLQTERMAFELRGPPSSAGVPAETYLKAPDWGPWPDLQLEKTDRLATKIAVEQLGDLGDGSLGFDVIVDPVSEPVDSIAVHADVTFNRSETFSGSYHAETREAFDVVRRSEKHQ